MINFHTRIRCSWAFVQHLLFYFILLEDQQDFQCYFYFNNRQLGSVLHSPFSLSWLSTFQSSPFEAIYEAQPRKTRLSSRPLCFLFFFLSTNAFSHYHKWHREFPTFEETVGISTPRVQSGISYSKSMFVMYYFYTYRFIYQPPILSLSLRHFTQFSWAFSGSDFYLGFYIEQLNGVASVTSTHKHPCLVLRRAAP